jgi:hypothetical protein
MYCAFARFLLRRRPSESPVLITCVCMCVCAYIYIYIYIYTHTHIYMYCAYARFYVTCIHTDGAACMSATPVLHVLRAEPTADVRVPGLLTSLCIHTYNIHHIHIHIHIQYIYVYIYIYIYTHAYTALK